MKHLIIGIDGTWRAAHDEVFHSNVFRLNVGLDTKDAAGNPQVFFYSSGVGTFGRKLSRSQALFGDGLDQLILGAYVNLVSNYDSGDKIYIFGFSRGAIAARALSGLISKAGLLKDHSADLTRQAWNLFIGQEQQYNILNQNLHHGVKIEFVGVWDTVAGPIDLSDAAALFDATRFRGQFLDKHVKCGVQILALDETRKAFNPVLWDGVTNSTQALEQIWMPGAHTDIGGGYPDGLLSVASFVTMLDCLKMYCPDLQFEDNFITTELAQIADQHDIYVHKEQSSWFSQQRLRCIEPHPKMNQSLHPLAEVLQTEDVYFQNRDRKSRYKSRSMNGRSIPIAKIHQRSFCYRLFANRWPNLQKHMK